jgi:cytochrome subunit of sulfide dehydrogenase
MRAIALILLVAAPAAAAPARADPPPPGALSCTGCHGDAGASAMPLDALPAEEIAEAMRAFADGEREATVMDRIARGFTPEEMQAIGIWFAQQRDRQ